MRSLNVLAVMFSVAVGAPSVASAEPVQIVYPETGHHAQILSEVLKEAYTRAGIDAEFRPLPSNRAIRLATSGDAAGTVSRIEAYGDRYPQMVRIEPPIASLLTTAFVRRDLGLEISGPEDLIDLRVGRIAGILHARSVSMEVKDITEVRSLSQLLEMLDSGRIDVAIHSRLPGEFEIARSRLDNIVAVETPLRSQPLFHYVHESRPEVATMIASSLEEMNISGELSDAFDQGAADLLASAGNME